MLATDAASLQEQLQQVIEIPNAQVLDFDGTRALGWDATAKRVIIKSLDGGTQEIDPGALIVCCDAKLLKGTS